MAAEAYLSDLPKADDLPSRKEFREEAAVVESPGKSASQHLVFDIGMNNGDDSAHYLSKGYTVVAVEANPDLVARSRTRFRKEISEGRISIEGVGIAECAGTLPFWINEERSEFSSFDRERAERQRMRCRRIDVPAVTFDTLLEKYGVPYYMKLDVEGAERHCLKCMQSFPSPQYISVEAETLEYLQLLWQLGYREFAIVDQMRHNSHLPNFSNRGVWSRTAKRACSFVDRVKNRVGRVPFARGSSGPFATEVTAEWQSFEEAAYEWLHLHFGHRDRGRLSPDSWYDFHARKSANNECPSKASAAQDSQAGDEKLTLR